MDLSDLTPVRYAAEQKKRAMRVNTKTALHEHAIGADNINRTVQSPNNPYKPKKRAVNEALPPAMDLFERPDYVTGDGDVGHTMRPGADDHLQCKSLGIGERHERETTA